MAGPDEAVREVGGMTETKGLFPSRCQDVTWEMGDPDCLAAADNPHSGRCDWEIGDLVYDPKMGEGHILTGTRVCGPDWYCGYCGGMCDTPSGGCGEWLCCECGGFDPGDHHGFLLAKAKA